MRTTTSEAPDGTEQMELSAFDTNQPGLDRAVQHLLERRSSGVPAPTELPHSLPDVGIGAIPTLDLLAPMVLEQSRDLSAPGFLAHMDPPTLWLTWATTMWTASRNQNLLHPDTAPTHEPSSNASSTGSHPSTANPAVT